MAVFGRRLFRSEKRIRKSKNSQIMVMVIGGVVKLDLWVKGYCNG